MKYSIYKQHGSTMDFKRQVKTFNSKQARDEFLNAQYDNSWGIQNVSVPSGIYQEAGIPLELRKMRGLDCIKCYVIGG